MQPDEKGVLSNSIIFFNTPSNFARSSFFHIICSGEFFCDGDYLVERNTYHSFLLMYIRKGCGCIIFGNRTYQAHEGDIVFLDCHQPHRYYTDTGWETLWIHFDGNSSREIFESIFSNAGVVIPITNSPVIIRYLSMIIDSLKNGRPLHEALISSHIHRMLAEIMLLTLNSKDTGTYRMSPVLDAVTYIQNCLKSKISIMDLAAYVRISPFHFSRLFKKETGFSPYEFVIKTRIDHAKVLLKKTSLSIKEIAYEVGFNSESNFINTFRDKVNLTPNDFRNTPL